MEKESNQKVKTPPCRHLEFCRKSYFMAKLLPVGPLPTIRPVTKFGDYILNHSSRPSYYKSKIFSTAVSTLNFDLDLSKVISEIWRRHRVS